MAEGNGICEKEQKTEKGSVTPYLSVSIENRSCITLLLDASYVDAIYLDSSCYTRENLFTALKEDVSRIHSAGKRRIISCRQYSGFLHFHFMKGIFPE